MKEIKMPHQSGTRIVKGQTLLFNTKSNCLFLAGRADEKTQLRFTNHSHIHLAGELDHPVKDCADMLRKFFNEHLNNGNKEYIETIRNKLESFIDTNCL